LIAKEPQKLETGFMTYSVTKPPIEITIDLICNIDLKNVKLWTHVGSLKSTGFELYAKNKCGEFLKIASAECEDYHQIVSFVCPGSQDIQVNHVKSQDFFIKSMYLLKCCSALKIVIKKTHRWTTPVLKKLQILGFPSRSLSKDEKKKIWQLWTESDVPIPLTYNPEKTEMKKVDEPTTEIPDDFLDEITYEIMALPMTLPSGKSVDQSTLEKHYKTEETWGRLPSDPFTGLIFTEKRKPILNAALKSQIDEFLLKNGNKPEYKNVPRTVGSNLKRAPPRLSLDCSKRIKLDVTKDKNQQPKSLDEAVQRALSNTTRYSVKAVKQIETENCFECKKPDDLYKIVICDHFICRSCSLSTTSSGLKMCCCGVQFNRNNIEKYHKSIVFR
jgi:hypothetical protein